MTRKWGVAITVSVLLLATCLGAMAHIGYFGGPVFIPVAATTTVPHPLQGPASRATVPHKPRVAAVLLSCDMGFAVGMGRNIAQRLAADGIPVMGVSSLTYFRHPRQPRDVAWLLTTAARRALASGHADRLILIGQSFGADMMHVGAQGLPPDLRRRVAMIALVVPGDHVIFRASPAEMFDWITPDAPALPTAKQLDWVPVLCVSGREETNSLCPLWHQRNVHWVALPGGHPLHRDADALYATIRRAIAPALATTAVSAAPPSSAQQSATS